MAALAGLTVLVVLDEGEAELLRRRVHEYQRAHPGSAPAVADRLSVNGAPALPGTNSLSLTHICCRCWSTLERLAPSLARRYSKSEPDGPPPKRRRCQGDGDRASATADERCWLVTAQWLEQTLRTTGGRAAGRARPRPAAAERRCPYAVSSRTSASCWWRHAASASQARQPDDRPAVRGHVHAKTQSG